ncbi:M-phase inducer phosphatase [Smittium mucronatum]|uniref:M-phase inducer phosphatase n=1 Tax=Smittium mucronatum TaxID=133383 RepID=A0A1R0H551_9FUNG|nr:M-phase inducer phosphatase [Smittium mucronatum]
MSLLTFNQHNDPFSDNSDSNCPDSNSDLERNHSMNVSDPLIKMPNFPLNRTKCISSTDYFNDVCSINYGVSFLTSPLQNKRKFTEMNSDDSIRSSLSIFGSPCNSLSTPTRSITSFPRPKNEILKPISSVTSPCISLNSRKNRLVVKQRAVSNALPICSDSFSDELDPFLESSAPKLITRTKSQSTSFAVQSFNLIDRESISTYDSSIDSAIPCISISNDPIKRINPATMSNLINGKYSNIIDELIIVDCRFPYEFKGGHIAIASNSPSIETLERQFLSNPPTDKKVVVVFHCEYSIKRAPSMARHLRQRDRELNILSYPKLFYPNIYVLQGGYSGFFQSHSQHCYPQKYIPMNDDDHVDDCRLLFKNFERQFKRCKSVNSLSSDLNLCSPTNYSKKISRTQSAHSEKSGNSNLFSIP